MEAPLDILQTSAACSLYQIRSSTAVERFIVSTPDTREICNDVLCLGVSYTRKLQRASEQALSALVRHADLQCEEGRSTVLTILRGGLNFGLRDALADAMVWNAHTEAFISAQRQKRDAGSADWYITESSYKKVTVPDGATVFCGDVVATGTTLLFALKTFLQFADEQGASVKQLVFFTIGSGETERVLEECDALCRKAFPKYERTILVYFEGQFQLATADSRERIKEPGTDLLRRGGILAPEFLSSQEDNPVFPLERCSIYDAGSRAFYPGEYLRDVAAYWEEVLHYATESGLDYTSYLSERMPELATKKSLSVSLEELSREHLARIKAEQDSLQTTPES